MELYIDNVSFGFTKKAYERIVENTEKTVFRAVIISKGTLKRGARRFFLKKRIYDIEYILYGTSQLKKALKLFNRKKHPINLTLVVSKPLTAKENAWLSEIRREVKITDTTSDNGNLEFYKSSKYILYKFGDTDTVLDADIMHIYKMGETEYQCRYNNCLGKTLYVSKNGNVYFCPYHTEESNVGTLKDQKDYFQDEKIISVLKGTLEKRRECKAKCQYYEECGGGCPLEKGCGEFPQLFEKNKAYIDRIIEDGDDLSKHSYAVAKLVIKDIVYEE